MKPALLLLFAIYCWAGICPAQQDHLFTQRQAQRNKTRELKNMVDLTVRLPFHDSVAARWRSAGWAMELMQYRPAGFNERWPEFTQHFSQLNADLQWTLLQTWYSLYPGQDILSLQQLLPFAKTEKIKALLLVHLKAAGMESGNVPFAESDPFYASPYFQAFEQWSLQKPSSITLDALMQNPILPGQSLIVSVQYRNRDKPGFLLIRDNVGNWIKNKRQQVVRFLQLARAVTNLPYFLTNGNTPQGLYKIVGLASSTNAWIGPTTNLQLVMPYETGNTGMFFTDTTHARSQYAALLGPYATLPGLWESFTAGQLGRSEIIAHGTAIPAVYYKNEPYYPLTPSLGCLCSPEQYKRSGNIKKSIQQQWIDRLQELPSLPSYLLVVEVKD